jgi:hypothetical protein
MRSRAQRAYLWANHPEVAREFEDATPKGAKLPAHVKKAHDLAVTAALRDFKLAGEELRLQLPTRKFHGYDAALRAAAESGHKKADAGPSPEPASEGGNAYGDRRDADNLEQILQGLDGLNPPGDQKDHKDPLDRTVHWGPTVNPQAGDTGSRAVDSGGPSGAGMVF